MKVLDNVYTTKRLFDQMETFKKIDVIFVSIFPYIFLFRILNDAKYSSDGFFSFSSFKEPLLTRPTRTTTTRLI